MKGVPLSDRAIHTRHVTVSDDLMIEVEDDLEDEAYFPARLLPPSLPSSPSDGSPRESAGRQKLVWAAVKDLRVSDRVEVYGKGIYELLTDPRPVRTGGREVGFEAEVMDPEALYPVSATLTEQGGTTVTEEVRVAVFAPSGEVRDRGDYHPYLGQAPIEHEADLQGRNRKLEVGDRVYRIVDAVPSFLVPYVSLTLKQTISEPPGS